jgi:hypothetical protein
MPRVERSLDPDGDFSLGLPQPADVDLLVTGDKSVLPSFITMARGSIPQTISPYSWP